MESDRTTDHPPEADMTVRLAVIGAGLIVIGLLHVAGSGTLTTVGGAVLLAVAGVAWFVQHKDKHPTR
jgi:uncharacterized membrane protein